MQQLVLQSPGQLQFRQVSDPSGDRSLQSGEALVRVRAVGVCGTDLHAIRGRQTFFTYPRVLGHELAVEIIELHPDVAAASGTHSLTPGLRCCVRPYLNCDRCRTCRAGKPNACEHLRVLGVHIDGGMQPHLVLPAACLHPTPDLTDTQAAVVEMLAISRHAVDRTAAFTHEAGPSHVLVRGVGPIGLAAAAFALADGHTVDALDLNPNRLKFAQRALGVQPASRGAGNPADDRPASHGERYDIVLECTGSARSMEQAFNDVAPGGVLVLVGHTPQPITFADADFHRREMSLLASRNATAVTFDRVLASLRAGEVDPTPWVNRRLTFDQAPAALQALLDDPQAIKAIIDMPST